MSIFRRHQRRRKSRIERFFDSISDIFDDIFDVFD